MPNCTFWIRDHDRALYEEKKVLLERIAEDIQSRFPNGAVTLSRERQL